MSASSSSTSPVVNQPSWSARKALYSFAGSLRRVATIARQARLVGDTASRLGRARHPEAPVAAIPARRPGGRVAAPLVHLAALGEPDRDQPPVDACAVTPVDDRQRGADRVGPPAAGVGVVRRGDAHGQRRVDKQVADPASLHPSAALVSFLGEGVIFMRNVRMHITSKSPAHVRRNHSCPAPDLTVRFNGRRSRRPWTSQSGVLSAQSLHGPRETHETQGASDAAQPATPRVRPRRRRRANGRIASSHPSAAAARAPDQATGGSELARTPRLETHREAALRAWS